MTLSRSVTQQIVDSVLLHCFNNIVGRLDLAKNLWCVLIVVCGVYYIFIFNLLYYILFVSCSNSHLDQYNYAFIVVILLLSALDK